MAHDKAKMLMMMEDAILIDYGQELVANDKKNTHTQTHTQTREIAKE